MSRRLLGFKLRVFVIVNGCLSDVQKRHVADHKNQVRYELKASYSPDLYVSDA